tara:strand:- start:2003 stop:2407 length:405 start_codon:yes stop_codon:yes gene_type:complete
MKTISIFIQVILSILGLATIGAFLANPSIYTSGFLLFGLGVTAILWWVAINLYRHAKPTDYLPKVAIYSGALLSSVSLFNLLAAYFGQQTNLSLIQVIAGCIGGVLIIRVGIKHQTLNKKVVRDSGAVAPPPHT